MEATKKSNPKEEFKALEQQANEYLDGWKRCKADFENYKKQQQEWANNFRDYANEDLLTELIPAIDNFELALDHIPQTAENKSWFEGVSHIKKQLEEILSRFGVKKIEAKPGDSFNPNIHECIQEIAPDPAKAETDSKPANVNNAKKLEKEERAPLRIAKIIRSGYLLKEKLIRPAQVTTEKEA